MSFTIGERIKMTVDGASHSESISVVIENLPAGATVDMDDILVFLKEGRAAALSILRQEKKKTCRIYSRGLKTADSQVSRSWQSS